MPLRIQYLVSDIFYLFACYFPGYRRKLVYENLRRAFPEKSAAEINSIARSFYRHLCDSLVETLALMGLGKRQIMKRFRYRNPGVLSRYYAEGKSVTVVFGHYGNWEWLAGLPLITPYKVLALYKPLRSKNFDRLVLSLRQKFGIRAVPEKKALRVLMEYKKKGEQTLTLFLGDQRPKLTRIHHWTTFFNRETPVFMGVEKISRKLDQPVLFFDIQKIKRGYYEVEIIPLFDDPGSTAPFQITEEHTRILERIIRKKPQYWLWSHKRWKYTKEEAE